jgi:hypothetical protein
MTDMTSAKFSIVIGGPFYRIQGRLGLLGNDLLPPLRTSLLFAAFVWLPLAVLSIVQGLAWQSQLGKSAFFLDYSGYARFIISIIMFMLMEPIAERRVGVMVRQFQRGHLIAEEEQGLLAAALQRAGQRTASTLAEIMLLILAYLLALNAADTYLSNMAESWFGSQSGGSIHLTFAGWWCLLVSLPFFWFLTLRWIWRIVVWTMLLNDLSKLKLRLVATHPDQSGGLGFLGMFPVTFAAMVFALSCVAASVTLQDVIFSDMSMQSVGALFGVWLVAVMVIFAGPLLVFTPKLYRLRDQALLDYGRFASLHNHGFEEKWVVPDRTTEDPVGTPDISSLADLGGGFETIRSIRVLPVGFETFKPLIIAAGLPWLGVVLTKVPLIELLSRVASALL